MLPRSLRVALSVAWLTPIVLSAQDVTPDGGSTTAPANNAQNVVGFWVYNIMGFPQTIDLSCGYSGSVSSCWLVENPIYVGTDESAWVNVYYSTGAAGSGTVTLNASGPGGSDGGSYNVTVTAPPGVQVTPDGQAVFANGNAQNTQRFTVKNTAAITYTYNIAPACSGGMTSCVIVGGATAVVLGPGIRRDVLVSYNAGAPGSTGTVQLTAWHGSTSDAGSVNVTSQYLTVNTDFNNNDNQSVAACAANCFDAAVAKSTPTYVSRDESHGVTLVYRNDRVALRPFVYADVKLTSGHPSPQRYWLEVRVNGAAVQFLNGPGADGANGEQRLYFSVPSPSSTTVRLGGQFDARPYATAGTGMYPMDIVVGVEYAGSTPEERVTATRLMLVDERRSQIARGWSIAGVQRIVAQTDSSVVLTEGDGSALHFASCGPGCFTSPAGEFSALTSAGSGSSLTYTRFYADSARAIFDNLGRLVRMVGRLYDTTSFVYDPVSGRLTRITDPHRERVWSCSGLCYVEKAYIRLDYGPYGLSEISERLGDYNAPVVGRSTLVTVASDSTLTVFKDPDGDSTRFSYDGSRRLEKIYSRRGDSVRFVYDPRSWKATQMQLSAVPIDAGGGSTTTGSPVLVYKPWHLVGVPTSATAGTPAPAAPVSSVVAVVTNPVGDSTRFTVDRWGSPLVVTDAVGGVTTITREAALVKEVLAPWGELTTIGYAPNSPLVTSIQRTGHSATNIEYDAFAQVKRVSGANQATQEIFRGLRGRVDSVQVAGVTSGKHYYDSKFRVDSVVDGGGHATKFHYDTETGNLDSTSSVGGRYSRIRFDLFGRDSAFKAVSQPTRIALYDAINRMVQFHDGVNPAPTVYTYDKHYLIRVRTARGQVFRRELNALGWVTRVFDPLDTLGLYQSYRYDSSGRVTSWTNRRGQIVNLKYDGLSRIVRKSGTFAPTDSFWYSPDRRQIVGISAASRDEIYLSSALWTDSIVTIIEGQRFSRYYRPTAIQQIDSIGISTTSGITFAARRYYWSTTRDALESLRVAGEFVGFSRSDDRWADTTTYVKFPTVVRRIDTYTSTHGAYNTRYDEGTINPHPVETQLWRGYGSDSLGRLRFAVQYFANLHSQFAYDSLGRLRKEQVDEVGGPVSECVTGQQAQDPAYAYGFICSPPSGGYETTRTATYDEVGNMLTWSPESGYRSYEMGNELTSSAGIWTYTHDQDGNLTGKVYNGSPFLDARLKWSADGLLLTDSNAVSGEAFQYDYNAFGQVVRKRRNGVTSRYFLWDGDHLLAELDSTATRRIAEYAYFPGFDNPLALITGSQAIAAVRYFHEDALGNVGALFAGTNVVQHIGYNVWSGAVTSLTGTLGDSSRLRWKGLMWDQGVTARYYVRGRWYDPAIGRFLSEDPIGIGGGLNEYVFAGGDPINGFDPFGTIPWWRPSPTERAMPLTCEDDWKRICFGRASRQFQGKEDFERAVGLGRVPDVVGGRGSRIRAAADLGVGFVPGLSTFHDAVTLFTGRNLVTGERVGWGGRIAAGIGFFTPMGGPAISAGARVIGEIPWTSLAVRRAANMLHRGISEITVANRSQAEELFLRRYQSHGYRNTTDIGYTDAKAWYEGKAGTYHWDPGGRGHDLPHVQIHTFEGTVVRIFFPEPK